MNFSSAESLSRHNFHEDVIYRAVVGSRAYGLERDDSDFDRRGFYLPPAQLQWSIDGVPEQLEKPGTDEVYWEIGKFLRLALKGNPNVLEVMYSPMVEHVTPMAQQLLDMRGKFLSKRIFQTFNGYAMSQLRKLGQDIRTHDAIKWKHAMHLIRLLLSGITAMRDQYVPVRVEERHRARLVAIRDGAVTWEEIDRWRLELGKQFLRAFEQSTLPEAPDYDAANAFLIKARRSAL
jgi:predicted nucleotidyltransferase